MSYMITHHFLLIMSRSSMFGAKGRGTSSREVPSYLDFQSMLATPFSRMHVTTPPVKYCGRLQRKQTVVRSLVELGFTTCVGLSLTSFRVRVLRKHKMRPCHVTSSVRPPHREKDSKTQMSQSAPLTRSLHPPCLALTKRSVNRIAFAMLSTSVLAYPAAAMSSSSEDRGTLPEPRLGRGRLASLSSFKATTWFPSTTSPIHARCIYPATASEYLR